jgi:BirA family transcriptional regulator, biotin operon repressor / biotin---[acetyl-CoA-carboxylase] ligase
MTFGSPRRHFRVTDSTNDRARELALAGAASGTIVTADAQTKGRGRQGRRWSAPPGKALLYSAILRPLDERHLLLPLAAALAVCEAIESGAPVGCRIKWPNDVWICEREGQSGEGEAGQADVGPSAKPEVVGRKAAGILIEARPPEFAVVGIGVNVAIEPDEFPGELRWPATSVGHGVGTASVREALDECLGEWVEAPAADVLAAFRERDVLAGREIAWEGAGESGSGTGVAEGVDQQGNLRVRTAAGKEVTLGAGEVRLTLR